MSESIAVGITLAVFSYALLPGSRVLSSLSD